MLLLIEIVLIVIAWRKGWKAWALVPIAVAFCTGLICGVVCGLTGTDVEQIMGICLVMEGFCIASLVVMAVRGRKLVPVIVKR
jgi:peptidoglycan/LPS O-acetylase OafA/YrhL